MNINNLSMTNNDWIIFSILLSDRSVKSFRIGDVYVDIHTYNISNHTAYVTIKKGNLEFTTHINENELNDKIIGMKCDKMKSDYVIITVLNTIMIAQHGVYLNIYINRYNGNIDAALTHIAGSTIDSKESLSSIDFSSDDGMRICKFSFEGEADDITIKYDPNNLLDTHIIEELEAV